MSSPELFGRRIGVLFVACALVGLLAVLMAIGPRGNALAQSGAPAPGWVQIAGGGWVPPTHPLAGGPAATPAPGNCGVHTLRGSYIFAASGYDIVAGVPRPKAIVEPIDFNGDGTLAAFAVTVSINGNVIRGTSGVGEYTVAAGCVGTITFTGPGFAFDVFIEPSGKQGWMIQTNPNTVFQGTLTRVSP